MTGFIKSGAEPEDGVYFFERVMVSIYATGSASSRYHVRDVGLVLVEPNVQISWADGVRQGRSDKVELTPREVYSVKT